MLPRLPGTLFSLSPPQTAQTRPLANSRSVGRHEFTRHPLPFLLRNGAGVQKPPANDGRMAKSAVLAKVWPFAQQITQCAHRQVGKAIDPRPGLCHGRSSYLKRVVLLPVFTTPGASSGSLAIPNSIASSRSEMPP